MRVAVLGSGSGGNSVVVESRGRHLLIDAGFSCRQIENRLASLGVEAESVEALLLTHEHQDHCRGADVFLRRHEIPAYATVGTLAALRESLARKAAARDAAVRDTAAHDTGARDTDKREKASRRRDPPDLRAVVSGEPFEVASEPAFRVEAFQLPHDAREPVGFVVEDDAGCRLGLVADLGCRTQLAWGRLRDLDCLVIETNHDLQMLRTGPYPWHLKQRVASRHGHLSNHEAAAGLPELVSDRLEAVFLYHLSETNNLPELAEQAVGERFATLGCDAEIIVTRQHEPTGWVEIPEGDARRSHLRGSGPLSRRLSEPRQLELW